ncbi:16252_t:CDS:2 [Funneliformis mosseae]|uniref:Mediator of RNA polymerase II transcription subunit 31 n=1 Tax=Funneliformis mosseae TaxID=27381 RepID=A0A9N9FVE5_FUNMO|nr:16252_t:CDS:2 [Funneliformis mosseae]
MSELAEGKLLASKTTSEAEKQDKRRFQIELEFIQCLANPWYLNDLAQKEYFEDQTFLNYLEYLKYWKRPEYAKCIIYPHALHFLDLLQNHKFREYLKDYDVASEIHSNQYYHWLKWRHFDEGNVGEGSRPNELRDNVENVNGIPFNENPGGGMLNGQGTR